MKRRDTKGVVMRQHIQQLMVSLILFSIIARAQNVSLIRVETSEPCTPIYQSEDGLETIQAKGMVQTSTSDRKWFRILVEYSTITEWTDRLTLEYYVLFPGETNVFKGAVSYVDIPRGREHLSEMYLHFNRYARHYKRGEIQYAVVALLDGKQVAVNTNKNKPENWWKTTPLHSGELLDRNATPFAVFNVEKFQAQDHRLQK
jgi:hypothetical protein